MKSYNKYYLMLGILFILSSIIFIGCTQNDESNGEDETKKITIITSFYPLFEFASKIAGDKAEVINIVPPSMEPHDFEPTPKDLIKISEADIFIYNGSGFESWIEDVLSSIDHSSMKVINVSDHIDLLSKEVTGGEIEHAHGEELGHEDGHEEHNEEDHESEAMDPHIWLDPVLAKEIALLIKGALIETEDVSKEIFEENYSLLANEFDKLHQEIEQSLSQSLKKEFIVSHSAFGYLAYRYGLEQVAISGLSPSDEPSQKELKDIISFAKEHDVKYILFETLVDPKVADVVRREIGAESLMLNPLEGLTIEEISQGKDYFSIMRENLETLKKALN